MAENILIKLSADTSDYTTKMQAASGSAKSLSANLEQPLSTGQKVEAGLTKVGTVVGALSLAVGVAAVKSFADFDQSMSAVHANTQAGAEDMDRLRDAALEAGARTVFSAKEAADGINELAKAGVSTKDVLSGGLTGALDLAASGQMGVADAAELTASALNEFGLEGSQASHVADLLSAGANTAQGGVSDMGEALKMVGVTASQTGMSIEDTTGALTMLASKGITGSDAGTQLRSALIGLTSASGPAREMMQQLGISMYDSSGEFVGLANFAGQLKDKLSALTPEQRANAMGVLFSNAAMSVGNTLYEQGAEGVEAYTKQVNQQGFAAKQAADLTDNLKGDVEQFGGAVDTALIKIGQGANGPLRSMTQGVTNAITAFGDLDPRVQQTVTVLGLVVGAAAVTHKTFGDLADSSNRFKQSLGMVLDPVQRLQAALPAFADSGHQFALALSSSSRQAETLGTTVSRSQALMGGFKAAGAGIIDMLGGPWGVAFTVAGAILMSWADKAAKASQAADDVSKSIQSTGDATETLVDQAQKMEVGDGIFKWFQQLDMEAKTLPDLLKQVGLSMSDMVAAAEGDDKALAKVNGTIQDLSHAYGAGSQKSKALQKALDDLTDAYDKGNTAAKQKEKAVEDVNKATGKSTAATNDNTDAHNKNADAQSKATDASQILTDQLHANAKGLDDNAAALGQEVDALKQYAGYALSAFDADTKWGKAITDADASLQKNGRTLDTNTQAGQANRDALKNLAQAAYETAEAHAKNGEGVDKVNQIMTEGRNKVIDYAKQMGMSEQDANSFADSIKLSSDQVNTLIAQIDKANAKPIQIKDEATKTLKNVNLAAKGLPDGKTIQITGKNKDAMLAIQEVTGAKIDDKHSTLTMDKHQYDMALALANGAKIDSKTGLLQGDNSQHWAKIAQSNGWTIDSKTGDIYANDGPFTVTKNAVENAKIKDKKVEVGAETHSFWDTINGILGQTFHINIGASGGHATGGLITGPGTGTSDSIPARLSNGEYVIRAAAVRQYGTDMLNAINWQQYATGGYVTRYAAGDPISKITPASRPDDSGNVIEAINSLKADLGPIINKYAPRLGERDAKRLVNSLVG